VKRAAVVILLLGALAPALAAQTNTAEMLQRAKRLYENVEVERALVILRQVISPELPYLVSAEQRIEAYKYLGASLALQAGAAKRDSAVLYFRAALERDPFVDLDPQSFSPAQLSAFAEARTRTFAAAVRPVRADTLAPGSGQITFQTLTTHRARLTVALHSPAGGRRVLYDGDNDGLRDVTWDGLLGDGSLAPPGRYELDVIGASHLLQIVDTETVYLDVQHLHPPLEDTLATLGPGDLLPELYPLSVATGNLLKGLGVAAGALLFQSVFTNSALGAGSALLSGAVAGVGTLTGVVSFSISQRHRDIPANIAENARRRAERESENAAIRGRNADRLRVLRLGIAQASGVGAGAMR
jgi:hypothetical protein